MSCFYYPTMYLAFLPLILRMNTTSSHDTPNATIAAAGICKGTGTPILRIRTTPGPVKKLMYHIDAKTTVSSQKLAHN